MEEPLTVNSSTDRDRLGAPLKFEDWPHSSIY